MDTYYLDSLQVAAGSIAGREHLRTGRDNQDSYSYVRTREALIGIVCDGCGSMPFSGIGAHLGARFLTRSLGVQLDEDPDRPLADLLEQAQQELLDHLAQLSEQLTPPGNPSKATSLRRFLFTVVGFLVRREETGLFACGDGLVSINGDAAALGPYPGNRPPYLGYHLMEDAPHRPNLEILTARPTQEIHSLVIGTDGLEDWIQLPDGTGAPTLGDTLEHPAAYRNPDFLRRRLTVAQRRGGSNALPDDTTLITVRRAER